MTEGSNFSNKNEMTVTQGDADSVRPLPWRSVGLGYSYFCVIAYSGIGIRFLLEILPDRHPTLFSRDFFLLSVLLFHSFPSRSFLSLLCLQPWPPASQLRLHCLTRSGLAKAKSIANVSTPRGYRHPPRGDGDVTA